MFENDNKHTISRVSPKDPYFFSANRRNLTYPCRVGIYVCVSFYIESISLVPHKLQQIIIFFK